MKYRVRKLVNGKFKAERKSWIFPWKSCWFAHDRSGWTEKTYKSRTEAERGIEKYISEKQYEKNPDIYPYKEKC